MTGTADRIHRLLTRSKREANPHVPRHPHPQLRKRIAKLEKAQTELQLGLEQRLVDLERRVADVEARTVEVEEGLQEHRRLSLRVAELTDMVTELIGAAAIGEEEFRRRLDEYARAARHD